MKELLQQCLLEVIEEWYGEDDTCHFSEPKIVAFYHRIDKLELHKDLVEGLALKLQKKGVCIPPTPEQIDSQAKDWAQWDGYATPNERQIARNSYQAGCAFASTHYTFAITTNSSSHE